MADWRCASENDCLHRHGNWWILDKMKPESMVLTREYLEMAISLDSGVADAYSYLAVYFVTLSRRPSWGPPLVNQRLPQGGQTDGENR